MTDTDVKASGRTIGWRCSAIQSLSSAAGVRQAGERTVQSGALAHVMHITQSELVGLGAIAIVNAGEPNEPRRPTDSGVCATWREFLARQALHRHWAAILNAVVHAIRSVLQARRKCSPTINDRTNFQA